MKDTSKNNKNQQPFRSETRRKKVEAAKKRAMEKQKQAQEHSGEHSEMEKQIDSAMEKIIHDTIGEEISKEKLGKETDLKSEEVQKNADLKEERLEEEPLKEETLKEETEEPVVEENTEEKNQGEDSISKEENDSTEKNNSEEENSEEKNLEQEVSREQELGDNKTEEEPVGIEAEKQEAVSAVAVESVPVMAQQGAESESADETGTAKKKIKTSMIAGAAAAVLVVGYAAGALYYTNHLFAGSKINGMNCANMTEKKAEEALKKQVESYVIELDFRNNESRTISGNDIGYQYTGSGDVKDVMKKQNPLLWVSGLFSKKNYSVEIDANFDETALRTQLDNLDCLQEANMEAPADAQIAFVDNQFVIQDETQGTTINEETLFTALEEAVHTSQNKLSVEKTGAYEKPEVTKEDETLIHQKDVWNSCATATITYTFGDEQEVLDGMQIKDWLSYDEDGNYVENKDAVMTHIKEYVLDLATRRNTMGRDRTITSTMTGEPVTISGGSYGFRIDQSEEAEQIYENIMNHDVVTREPAYASRATVYSMTGDDIGNTYVEVDLGNQHLWYYKNGTLIMDTDFVSGTYTISDRRTPSGAYSLMYKQKDQVLRGTRSADGSYEYESPVKYWMPFNGGIGFHDASWRYSFGGSIFMYSGSHGCINLPSSMAAELYENIEAGCPVLCFY